ncbi:MAG TPA: hypothetical protein VKT28_06670 [Puia sp.]|nr:hypothetical protein [Puia sp.]
MKPIKSLIPLLFFFYQPIFAQEKLLTQEEKDFVIPFQLTDHNNISIMAVLNGQDTVHLMFHTAADDVTLIENSTARLKSLRFNGVTDSVKSWGGQSNTSRLSENNSLQIGELKWTNVSIWENTNTGQNTDGKFGPNLFKNKVIEIDFDKSIIVIHPTLPDKTKKYEKLKLLFEHNFMLLEATCQINDSSFTNKFLIHSGYAGDILFDDKFADEKKLSEKLKIVGEKELKDSYGNVLKTKKAILPILKIGNEKFADMPVGFFQGAIGRQKVSVMGGDVLKRFNIIIDAQREYVYLKPNKLKKAEYFKS